MKVLYIHVLWSVSISYSIFGATVLNADDYRATEGLQILYDFAETKGNVVRDQSGTGDAYDLQITDVKAVKRSGGALQILKPTIISSKNAPTALIEAVRTSGEITIEAWMEPKDTKQAGPARLVTLSKNSNERNFTLGQDGDKLDARLRTTKTSTNGIPSLAAPSKSLTTKLTHVVCTRQQDGTARIYQNGKQVVQKKVAGNFSNWDKSLKLALVDEHSKGRPWLGTLHLVAIYDRALSSKEVNQNFDAGAAGRPSPELIAERQRRVAARHFETTVAPLLARRCLECHDSAIHESELDLSTQLAAFRGSENGKVIIPGAAAKSPLWAAVESDSMPHERDPLTSAEKGVLKKWIDDGAVWTLRQIDPAIYVHGSENQNWVQRLTVDEYIETVRTTVGVDIKKEAREILPRDLRADGFSNTAYNLNVDFKHVNAYAKLAEIVVSRMDVGSFVGKFSKRRKFTDKDMADVIENLGAWVLRGPIDDREVIAYRGITTTVASAGGDFEEAMEFVLEAMLQSPRFIYRVVRQQGNGSQIPATDYELASRLSYIVWGSSPDRKLMEAADEGKLNVEKEIVRMLEDRRAVQQSLRFVSDWLNLNRLNNLRPNAARFPQWNDQLASDMRDETLAFFEEVIWKQGKSLSALLNSEVTFASPELAKFYGLSAAGKANEFAKFDLKDVRGRGGLLTQGSVLTVGGDDASMVTRGLLVMHELLRGVVNDPPPCVDTTPVPTKAGLTQRSIAMGRISNASCGGCHKKFEPLAFGLEKFDGIGAYHEQDEHGNKLRDDGEVLFPGGAEPLKFNSTGELMNLLAKSERVSQSLTWKVTQFALGRPLVAEDAATVDSIHEAATKNGGTWSALMTAIVTSDLVLKTRTRVSE